MRSKNKHKKTRLYWNAKQIAFLRSKQKQRLFLGGRGVGKTSVIGECQYNAVAYFPRGRSFLSSSTYAQILTKSLAEMQAVWERHGLVEGFHYVIGRRPPDDFVKPYRQPKKFENIISWGNGHVTEFLSMDRPDLARGGSYDCGNIDEAALVKEESYTRVILPSVRGNREKFGHIPSHHQVGLFSSVPWKPKGYWLLKFEEWAQEDPNEFFFLEATTMDNIAVLGVEYIERLKKTLPWLEYQVEILNRRIKKIYGGFYHAFDPDTHCRIDTFEYKTTASGIIVAGEKGDVRSNMPIDFTVDFGGRFNCGLAIQTKDNQVNILKEFFVKDDRKLKELVADFCAHFDDHKMKVVRLYGEPRGNDRQPDSVPLFGKMYSYFVSEGWDVEICAESSSEDHVTRYNLMTTIFEETDERFPKVRVNENNCKNFILVLQTTDVNDQMKKDKSKERDQSFPQEQAPHLSDAFDNYMTQLFGHLLNSDDTHYLPNSTIVM